MELGAPFSGLVLSPNGELTVSPADRVSVAGKRVRGWGGSGGGGGGVRVELTTVRLKLTRHSLGRCLSGGCRRVVALVMARSLPRSLYQSTCLRALQRRAHQPRVQVSGATRTFHLALDFFIEMLLVQLEFICLFQGWYAGYCFLCGGSFVVFAPLGCCSRLCGSIERMLRRPFLLLREC